MTRLSSAQIVERLVTMLNTTRRNLEYYREVSSPEVIQSTEALIAEMESTISKYQTLEALAAVAS